MKVKVDRVNLGDINDSKSKTRGYELRVQINKLRVQIHELRVQFLKLRVQINSKLKARVGRLKAPVRR